MYCPVCGAPWEGGGLPGANDNTVRCAGCGHVMSTHTTIHRRREKSKRWRNGKRRRKFREE